MPYQAGFCKHMLPRLQGLQHKSLVQVWPCSHDNSIQTGVIDDVLPVSRSLYRSGKPDMSHVADCSSAIAVSYWGHEQVQNPLQAPQGAVIRPWEVCQRSMHAGEVSQRGVTAHACLCNTKLLADLGC